MKALITSAAIAVTTMLSGCGQQPLVNTSEVPAATPVYSIVVSNNGDVIIPTVAIQDCDDYITDKDRELKRARFGSTMSALKPIKEALSNTTFDATTFDGLSGRVNCGNDVGYPYSLYTGLEILEDEQNITKQELEKKTYGYIGIRATLNPTTEYNSERDASLSMIGLNLNPGRIAIIYNSTIEGNECNGYMVKKDGSIVAEGVQCQSDRPAAEAAAQIAAIRSFASN